MSQIDNIDNIAFSTAFEIDKLFDDLFTGSFAVAASAFPGSAGNIVTSSVSNPYGESVLPVMQFSTDNSTWYEAGSRIFTAGATLTPNFSATCYTDSSNIVIIGQNFTNASQTCYYRIRLISDD